jgi:hypothetical protein
MMLTMRFGDPFEPRLSVANAGTIASKNGNVNETPAARRNERLGSLRFVMA